MKRDLAFDEQQSVRTALSAAAAADGLGTPDRVEFVLLAAARGRRRRRMAGRLAAAGFLAAMVFVGVYSMRPPAMPVPAPVAVVSPPAMPVSAPGPAPVAVLGPRAIPVPEAVPTHVSAAKRVSAPRRPRAARPVHRPAPALAANDFIPVGPWQAIEPMERGSIVRVRLPKSSLPGLGIPVSAERWNESIPADVLLGEDGSMRAVRFVSVRQ